RFSTLVNKMQDLAAMESAAKLDKRAGWEMIWRRGDDHPRYGVAAAPNPAVVEWAETVPAQGFVLDLGCGVGRHVVYLAERGFRMAGVDISPSGIRLAQEVCSVRRFNFEGHVSDMSALPWRDDTFDAVLSISAIHHHQRREIVRTLGEVRRVLKPGGLLLADFPCTDTTDYRLMRTQVSAGQIAEVEPDTFVDHAQVWKTRMMAFCLITTATTPTCTIYWARSTASG